MCSPTISIIIPVYNVEPYIEACVRSVIRQTYNGNLECIVVDDCGTDHSMEIVEKMIVDYDGPIHFFVLHHTYNRGLSAARNTGMDAATGDYLFFLDSDDKLTDDGIELLTKPLKTEWVDVISGKTICIINVSSSSQQSLSCHQKNNLIDIELMRRPFILQNYKTKWEVVAWNKLYKTSFIRGNNLKFKEGLIHEDVLWSFQIACLALSLCVVNKNTYIYNKQREGSISCLYGKDKRIIALIDILKEMSAFVDNHHIESKELFRLFSIYFKEVTNYYSDSLFNYVSIYKSLRPLFKAPMKCILQNANYNVKSFIREFHYFLPTWIAPYWQYIIYFRLRPLIKQK